MRVGRTVGRYLAGALVLAVVITGGLIIRIMTAADDSAPVPSDVIVVLGAAQYDGRPSPVLQARLDHARELYADGVADVVMTVGGGAPGDRTTEAAAGAQYLIDAGVPESAVVAVAKGTDTLTSVRAAARRAAREGWTSVVLVSDPWHVARASMIATDAGLHVDLAPVTDGPATADAVEARYVWRELLGTLYYRLIGGSSGAGGAVL